MCFRSVAWYISGSVYWVARMWNSTCTVIGQYKPPDSENQASIHYLNNSHHRPWTG